MQTSYCHTLEPHCTHTVQEWGRNSKVKELDEEMCCFPSPPQHQDAGILGKIIRFFVLIKVSSWCDVVKVVSASNIEEYVVHPELNNLFTVATGS